MKLLFASLILLVFTVASQAQYSYGGHGYYYGNGGLRHSYQNYGGRGYSRPAPHTYYTPRGGYNWNYGGGNRGYLGGRGGGWGGEW